MSDKKLQIAQEMARLSAELKNIQDQEIADLAKRASALSQKYEWMPKIIEAMLHAKLGIKPKTKQLGYELAEIDFLLQNTWNYPRGTKFPKDDLALIDEVFTHFDISDYVFRSTHYEECSNGHYFRRS